MKKNTCLPKILAVLLTGCVSMVAHADYSSSTFTTKDLTVTQGADANLTLTPVDMPDAGTWGNRYVVATLHALTMSAAPGTSIAVMFTSGRPMPFPGAGVIIPEQNGGAGTLPVLIGGCSGNTGTLAGSGGHQWLHWDGVTDLNCEVYTSQPIEAQAGTYLLSIDAAVRTE